MKVLILAALIAAAISWPILIPVFIVFAIIGWFLKLIASVS